jgi:hypothetical protein
MPPLTHKLPPAPPAHCSHSSLARSYEGRCSLPSNFDATYCNALGQAAGALLAAGRTGLMATISSECALVGQYGAQLMGQYTAVLSFLWD